MLWKKDVFCPEDWGEVSGGDKIPGRGEIMGRGGNKPTTNNTNTTNKKGFYTAYVPVLQLKLQTQVWCPLNPMKV